LKIFNKKIKNPLKKDSSFALVSNSKIEDDKRLEQAKALLLKQNSEEEFKDLDGEESLNQEVEDEDDFERDEDLSRTETIDSLKTERRKLDSLRQIYAELEKEDQEENLKIRILKKKASIQNKREKMQEYNDMKAERDKFYEEPQNDEGYWILKDTKWNEEYDGLLIQLARATNEEQRKPIQKELKRLENIKKKNKAKNTMNKITRGINKTTQKIASVSQGIGKFADEIGQMGNSMGAVGSDKQRKASGKTTKKNEFDGFEDFFKDKGSKRQEGIDFFSPKTTKKKATKTKTTKRKTTKKKKKVTKKKKKTPKKKAKKRTTKKSPPKKKGTDWENFFK